MLDGVVTCVATIHFNLCGLMPVSHLFNFSVSESKVTMSVPLAPPPPPQSVNLDRLGEVLKNQMMPVLNGFKAQVEEQLRKSSEAEEESRQALKVELLGEHNRLQKRVGTMLQSDLKRRASDSLVEEVAQSLRMMKASPNLWMLRISLFSRIRRCRDLLLARKKRCCGLKLEGCLTALAMIAGKRSKCPDW